MVIFVLLTWIQDVCNDYVLSVHDVAHVVKDCIRDKENGEHQECCHSNKDPISAGTCISISTIRFLASFAWYASEYHNCKHLQEAN